MRLSPIGHIAGAKCFQVSDSNAKCKGEGGPEEGMLLLQAVETSLQARTLIDADRTLAIRCLHCVEVSGSTEASTCWNQIMIRGHNLHDRQSGKLPFYEAIVAHNLRVGEK